MSVCKKITCKHAENGSAGLGPEEHEEDGHDGRTDHDPHEKIHPAETQTHPVEDHRKRAHEQPEQHDHTATELEQLLPRRLFTRSPVNAALSRGGSLRIAALKHVTSVDRCSHAQ